MNAEYSTRLRRRSRWASSALVMVALVNLAAFLLDWPAGAKRALETCISILGGFICGTLLALGADA